MNFASNGAKLIPLRGHMVHFPRRFAAQAMRKQPKAAISPSFSTSLSLNLLNCSPKAKTVTKVSPELQVSNSFGFTQLPVHNLRESNASARYDLAPSSFHHLREATLIGEGIFAKVYKCQDRIAAKDVAIKVVQKSQGSRKVIVQEMKVMAEIKRTGVNTSALALQKDFFETDSELCFVFELQHGGDLFDEVVDNGSLSETQAKTVMKSILPSIASMHEKHFVHRDIKLENLLISEAPSSQTDRTRRLSSVKVSDFGYSKKLGVADIFNNPAGTFGYVAPEVLSSRSYSPACDVWSLGVTMFTAVAGYQPFPFPDSVESVSSNPIDREIEAIEFGCSEEMWNNEMNKPAFASCSNEFKDLLRKMLDPNPSTRISSGGIGRHCWMIEEVESVRRRMTV